MAPLPVTVSAPHAFANLRTSLSRPSSYHGLKTREGISSERGNNKGTTLTMNFFNEKVTFGKE